MIFAEALDVLRKGNGVGATEDEAAATIRSEISRAKNLELILVTLVNELQHSSNPSFSYQILEAIVLSGNSRIEESFVLRQLFIDNTLESKSVLDGVWKCMSALTLCTMIVGEENTKGVSP